MLVIRKVEFLEVNKDPLELLATTQPGMPVECGEELVPVDFFKELIRGRRFVRPSDGIDIIVGCSRQAEEVIGLQYEAWDNLQNAYAAEQINHHRTTSEMYEYKSRVDEMFRSSFWQRLKWLVIGYR